MAMVNKEREGRGVAGEREGGRGREEGEEGRREGREGEPFLFLIRWREGEKESGKSSSRSLVYSVTSLDDGNGM